MKMIATTNFKHARFAFDKSEGKGAKGYEVPDKIGGYFEINGWGREATPEELQTGEFKPVPLELLNVDSPQPRPTAPGQTETLSVGDVQKISASDVGRLEDVLGTKP